MNTLSHYIHTASGQTLSAELNAPGSSTIAVYVHDSTLNKGCHAFLNADEAVALATQLLNAVADTTR